MSYDIPKTTLGAIRPGEGRNYRLWVKKVIDGVVTNDPEDLTAATIKFTAKTSVTDLDAAAILQLTVGSGITIDHPTLGGALIGVTSTHTKAITPARLHFDVLVTPSGKEPSVVAWGVWPVVEGVADPPE